LLGPQSPDREALLEIVRAAVTPTVRIGADDTQLHTVPTGSPLQPLACNLYLCAMDRALSGIDGGFYARYGDDILFAHPQLEVARQAAASIASHLRDRQLESNPQAEANSYFTAPGRSPAQPDFHPARSVELLGFKVDFAGRIGLKAKHWRALVRDLRDRLWRTRAVLRELCERHPKERARVLCEVVNAALDPGHPLALDAAGFLHGHVDDRGQLRAFDHLVALAVAESATGVRGPRALRRVPYRWLREEAGLRSAVRAHDRARSGRAASAPSRVSP
jgi:hypothetical protein